MIAEALAGVTLTAVLVVVTPASFGTVATVVPPPRCDAYRSAAASGWTSQCRGAWLPGFHVPGVVVCEELPAGTHCWTRFP